MINTRIRATGVAFLVASIILTFASPALADSTQHQIHVIDAQFSDALNNVTFLSANTADELVIRFSSEYPDFSQAVATAASGYQAAAASASNATLRTFANELSQATQQIGTALTTMNTAIAQQDSTALEAGANQLADALKGYGTTADSYNNYLRSHPEVGHPLLWVYLGLLVVSVLLALGTAVFWLVAPAPPGDAPAAQLKRMRLSLFLTALAPVAGSAVTYFWYRYTITHGGTYFILYGPVLAGFVGFFVRFKRYRQAVSHIDTRPATISYPGEPAMPVYAQPPTWPLPTAGTPEGRMP